MLKDIEVGALVPAFSPNAPFSLDVVPPVGVLKDLSFYTNGTHTTAITTAATDGEANIIDSLRIECPFKTRPSLVTDLDARDLKQVAALWGGTVPANTVTAADGGAHYGIFKVPFGPPDVLAKNAAQYGINTAELSGPIRISGRWGAAANLGTGATALASNTFVSMGIEQAAREQALAALCFVRNRFSFESASKFGPLTLALGNSQALWGVYVRQHDNSATAAQRVDSLLNRFVLKHGALGDLVDNQWFTLKKETAWYTKMSAAEAIAGVVLLPMDEGSVIDNMPVLQGAEGLTCILDGSGTFSAETTATTPASADAMFVGVIGVQLSAHAINRLSRGRSANVR